MYASASGVKVYSNHGNSQFENRANEEHLLGSQASSMLPPGLGVIVATVIMTGLDLWWTYMRVWARRQRDLSLFNTEDILCYLALVSAILQTCISLGLTLDSSAT